jgi:uncharacterized membrane protein YqjE
MRIHATNGGSPGLGAAVKQVSEHASRLMRLELELAQLELKQKASALGAGVGLMVGAAVFGLFALGFLLATFASALSNAVAMWLALLIVAVFVAIVATVLALLGRRSLQKGSPPVPKQAIEEAKITSTTLRGD